MKHKLLRFCLLSLLAMLCGNVLADEVTMKYDGGTTTNMTGDNDAALFGLDDAAWNVVGEQGGNQNLPGLNKAGDLRLYWSADGGNTVTVQALSGVTINSIAITYTGASYSNAWVAVNGLEVEGQDGVYTINGRAFVIGNANTSNVQVRISQIVINYGSAADTRTATTIALGEHATTGVVGGTATVPEATVKAGETVVEGAAVEWTSETPDVAAISEGVISFKSAGTAVIKASYAGDNTYKASSASYTVAVTAAPYTSFKALQEAATTTSTPATIQFSGQQVVFVNGSNAYLADADGYGMLVYTKNHGLEAGQVLNGTINAALQLYNGAAEITNFTTGGLTVTTADVVPVEMTVGKIGIANQSTLVTLKNVTATVSEDGKTITLADGESTITFYDKFKTGIEMEDGKAYDVTGIVIPFKEVIEICPRTADDVTAAKPAEPAGFQPFEITNEDMSGAFDTSKLPAGVVFSGTQRNDNHGYGNVTIAVPVMGAVKFSIGGCQYANPAVCKVANANGELLAELNLKTEKCYHQDGTVVTFEYKGEPTTLTFSDIAYLPYFKAEAVAPKEKITLDNEAVTVTFAFNEGTEGQKAAFSNDDYFLNSKVTCGSNLTLKDKYTLKDAETDEDISETRLEPAGKLNTADEQSAVRFTFTPKPGFTFLPTKVSFWTTRYGTDNGLVDVTWEGADGKKIVLATEVKPARNNGKPNISKLAYDIEGATAAEGTQTLLLHLYGLQENKQFGLSNIVIEGILDGTEKDVPILASFKVNEKEYAVEDVFGEAYEATLELPKAEAMVSESNPLTDVTATSGDLGTIVYEAAEASCTVTIPMTSGETTMNYVLNVVFKPDFTLEYLDVEGKVLATQKVEKDAAIGEFAFDIAEVPATKEGYKARGWFETAVLGKKFKTTDVITANTKLYAIQTEIEEVSTHKKYNFDLCDELFYAEDHEAFNPTGQGYWHDKQHGWAFRTGDKIDLLVGPKAVVSVTLCRYGNADDITITENGEQIGTLPGKNNENVDGETVAFNYEGQGGTITLNLNTTGEMYIHGVKIVNIAEVNFANEGNWYFVKAGDAGSLTDVLDVVNGRNAAKDAERAFIFLPDGTYDLDATVKTAISGHNISIIGQSMDKTIITTKPDKSIEGLGSADMFQASATNLYLQDLTLQNALDYYNAGSAGRAAVLQDAGTRTIGKNVRMLSYQDTYYSSNSSQQAYWETCDIHGTVDFICGGGDIRFQNTTISLEPRKADGTGSRTITAPTTTTQFGYVFDGCKVADLAKGNGNWNYGRTWQNEPVCVFLNTTLDDNAKNTIIGTRWIEKGMNNRDPKLFGEYGTKDSSGNDITPASNLINSFGGSLETILSAEKAAEFAYDKMFTDWNPALLARQLDAPAATYANGKVTWVPANNGAIAYALFKNGVFAGITEGSSFEMEAGADDVLTIRAANSQGGFGEAALVTSGTSGIEEIDHEKLNSEDAVYDLQGRRLKSQFPNGRHQLIIVNGKKVVR